MEITTLFVVIQGLPQGCVPAAPIHKEEVHPTPWVQGLGFRRLGFRGLGLRGSSSNSLEEG